MRSSPRTVRRAERTVRPGFQPSTWLPEIVVGFVGVGIARSECLSSGLRGCEEADAAKGVVVVEAAEPVQEGHVPHAEVLEAAEEPFDVVGRADRGQVRVAQHVEGCVGFELDACHGVQDAREGGTRELSGLVIGRCREPEHDDNCVASWAVVAAFGQAVLVGGEVLCDLRVTGGQWRHQHEEVMSTPADVGRRHRSASSDVDRWVRTLAYGDVQRVVTLVARGRCTEAGQDFVEAHLEQLAALLVGDSSSRELELIARADAQIEPAAGDRVDQRVVLGGEHGRSHGHDCHRRPEADRAGLGCHRSEQDRWIGDKSELAEVVLSDPDAREPERLGFARLGDRGSQLGVGRDAELWVVVEEQEQRTFHTRRLYWYLGTFQPRRVRFGRIRVMPDKRVAVERVQTGVRLEKRMLKVLRALADYFDISMSELLEAIVLHAFDHKLLPIGEHELQVIADLKQVYGLDLDSGASHNMIEMPTGGVPPDPRAG